MIWQLSKAMWAGEHTDLRFKAEKLELELTVGVERSTEPGVKVRFWVFDAVPPPCISHPKAACIP